MEQWLSQSMETVGNDMKEGLPKIAKEFLKSNCTAPNMSSFPNPSIPQCSFGTQMTPKKQVPPNDDDLFGTDF